MTHSTIKSVALVAAFAVTTVSFGEVSHAAKAPAQTRVDISDLDLTVEQGRQEMHRRIKQAARKVCREETSNSPAILNSQATCFQDTLKRTNAMVAARMDSQHRESLAATTVDPNVVPKTR